MNEFQQPRTSSSALETSLGPSKNPSTSSLSNYNEAVSNSVRSHGRSNLVADPLTNYGEKKTSNMTITVNERRKQDTKIRLRLKVRADVRPLAQRLCIIANLKESITA
jgi:hypothetical protein